MEQGDAERFFKLNDLRADRRLLNAVWNVAHRLTNASVPGDVIEQLQMMDVHDSNGFAQHSNSCVTGHKRQPAAGRDSDGKVRVCARPYSAIGTLIRIACVQAASKCATHQARYRDTSRP